MGYGIVNEWSSILSGAGIPLTVEGIIEALQNPALDIRAGAAVIVGRSNMNQAIPFLKRLSGDDPLVQVEAAMSLALLQEGSGIPALIDLLDGDILTGAPITAAGYLADLGDPRGFPVILKALNSEFTGNRLIAAVKIKYFLQYHNQMINGVKTDLFPIIKTALSDPDPKVRRELLYKLARLHDPRSSFLLSAVSLSDTNEEVRHLARRLLDVMEINNIKYKTLYSRINNQPS
jgi:HEAT repeat protein